jgi:predicted nuclease of restriction endonuclease-like (RecB) superfamily
MKNDVQHYADLLNTIKSRIRQAQTRAVFAANREMLVLYWDIGRIIVQQQDIEGWGAGVLRRLARDLHNELPDVKGFSERNLKLMTQFYREYPLIFSIGQQGVAQLADSRKHSSTRRVQSGKGMSGEEWENVQQLVAQLPWGHNVLLIQKLKDLSTRLWYMQKTIEQGWGRNVLHVMIDNHAHQRQGKAVTNFPKTLPQPHSDLAQETLKDPYVFDFLSLRDDYNERVLEQGLIDHVQKFLMELGAGFAFVGRQVHLEVGGEDFYVDLLLYHLRLRCFVVIDLKVKEFVPEFAGKMNFYLSAVDDLLRHPDDKPSIGLILCKSRNKVVAEYALRDIRKPVGISGYVTRLTESLPKKLKGLLPSPEEIEAELSKKDGEKGGG